jgi:3-oxoacyl-(acyl-carrier-protein) synthase/acyl carrier protein
VRHNHNAAAAVIGISFELPQCARWDTATEIFREGRACIRSMPLSRQKITGARVPDGGVEAGWIENVAAFDYRYFGLSRAEAEFIDPRQRRALQLAVMAIGNAGYAVGEISGGSAGVLVAGYGGPHPSLYNLLSEDDRRNGMAVTGSLHAYAAGRVAYHLDLRGPALVIDTACSSFLVALHQARFMLAHGETDLMLVGGYELVLGPVPRRETVGIRVVSGTNQCRPFDAAADGTTCGEGGGFVLLKRLHDAIRDGDHVHAVILGSAVNQDAGRSSGLTAPSPAAQADVLAAAWHSADVDPATISYLEAHGTGTRIGDPIEIHAISEAFRRYPARKSPCQISSAKANFGHLGCMAGLAGLVRVIAQFRATEIFPTAHFSTLNPLITMDPSMLRIADHRVPWPVDAMPRRAGLSGFGLSGTNAHAVVEEPPPRESPAAVRGERVILLSARDDADLRRQVSDLRAIIADRPARFDLAAASDVLAIGREHLPCRMNWVVTDPADLLEQLSAWPSSHPMQAVTSGSLVFTIGDGTGTDPDELGMHIHADSYPGFARAFAQAERERRRELWTPAQRRAMWALGMASALADFGVHPDLVLAHGIGTIVAQALNGEMDLAALLKKTERPAAAPAPPDSQRLADALAELGDEVTLIDLMDGTLSDEVAGLLQPGLTVTHASSLPQILATLHRQGRDLAWRSGMNAARRRIELPLPALDEQACWPPGTAPGAADAVTSETAPGEAGLLTASGGIVTAGDVVVQAAREVLKNSELTLADDFFEHGGTSLNGVQLVERLNERLGSQLDAMDLFDFPTLADIAKALERSLPTTAGNAAVTPDAPPRAAEGADVAPLSGQQRAIWAAALLAPESAAYNVPGALLLNGPVDVEWLTTQLTTLVGRHPMLRCILRDDAEGPVQVVKAAEETQVVLQQVAAGFPGLTAEHGRARLIAWLHDLVSEPLSLQDGTPPVRFYLASARFEDSVEHALLMVFHHVFFDGWSWRIVMDDLARGVPRGPQARSYLDYVREQQHLLDGSQGEALEQFWASYLAGARPTSLPAEHAATTEPALSLTGSDLPLPIGTDLGDRLRTVARRERVTLNTVLLAAWIALLWRISGDRDVCVAMPAANRSAPDVAIVGCYANTIAVRVRLNPRGRFSVLVAEVRGALLAALAHQELPSDRIRKAARPDSAELVASTIFGFQSDLIPIERIGPNGPAVELLDVGSPQSTFLLDLAILEYGDGLWARMRCSQLFTEQTVQGWLGAYHQLLEEIAARGTGPDLLSLFGPTDEDRHEEFPPDFDF